MCTTGPRFAERYDIPLHVVNDVVDPTFRFMTLDWDGRIRMDPSSKYAMQTLIGMKDKYDISVACDTDHDRHGIVTRSGGLLPPNHYLAVCIEFLFNHRPQWGQSKSIGKTVVSSSMIDRVAHKLEAKLYQVPVGFKYFVDGLLHGRLGFAGEESAGSSFLRHDGSVWTTDKDGIIAALLAAEITAKRRQDPGQIYRKLADELGESCYERTEAAATSDQKAALAVMSKENVTTAALAGEEILYVLTNAPGDGNPIGGIKVIAKNGWFAARPSGTEAIYKIYAESFRGQAHLEAIQVEAEAIVNKAFVDAASPAGSMELQETR